MNCGDVIIAAAGTYTTNFNGAFGQVNNCPSTSGGIDGTGGIYFAVLLCGGNVGTCTRTDNSLVGGAIININERNNWAVEGWKASGTQTRAFQGQACTVGTNRHHIAFINNIAADTAAGFIMNDCGIANPAGPGIDYFAVVGSIAVNAASDPICLGAIDSAGPANFDSGTGTRHYFSGNFGIRNRTINGCSDGEAVYFDTFDAHAYTGQSVMENNLTYSSSFAGVGVFMQSINSSALTMKLYNNTLYNDLAAPGKVYGNAGMINLQLNGGFPWNIAVYKNISQSTTAAAPNGDTVWALLNGIQNAGPTVTIGGSGIENVFITPGHGGCPGTSCDASGRHVVAYNGSVGTNFYVDPLFKNTADLLANHVTTPNCSAFETTAACMGWNHVTRTASTLSVIDDLTPQNAQAIGKGYQPPGDCAANALYPTWLKGIVYLHWDGAALTSKDGLVTKPCGM